MNAKSRANLRLQLTYGGQTLMDNSELIALLDICDEVEMAIESAKPEDVQSVANDIRDALSEIESIASGLRNLQRRCAA